MYVQFTYKRFICMGHYNLRHLLCSWDLVPAEGMTVCPGWLQISVASYLGWVSLDLLCGFWGPASSPTPQAAGLLPMLQDASHRPFTMLWPTDSALRALPPERQTWLYHEDHRDKLAAILRGHVIRNIEVGTDPIFGPCCLHAQLQSCLHLFRPWHLTYLTWANSEPCTEIPSLSPVAVPGL